MKVLITDNFEKYTFAKDLKKIQTIKKEALKISFQKEKNLLYMYYSVTFILYAFISTNSALKKKKKA